MTAHPPTTRRRVRAFSHHRGLGMSLPAACILLNACTGVVDPDDTPPAVVDMALARAPDALSPGDTAQLRPILYDVDGEVVSGEVVSGEVTFSSTDPAVARVDALGLVTARALGSTSVVATFETDFGPLADTLALTVLELRFTRLESGGRGHCALDEDGAAYCWSVAWANGRTIQRAAGPTGRGTAPEALSDELRFAMLTLGASFSCGLTTDARTFCWGEDRSQCSFLGGLCSSYIVSSRRPREKAVNYTFTTLAAGAQHLCGLTSDGEAYCWGSNYSGQLGNGASGRSEGGPRRVHGEQVFTALAAGAGHTCALRVDGRALCWGSNTGHQLGVGHGGESHRCGTLILTPCRTRPVEVSGDHVFTSLVAEAFSTCGLTADGEAYCWGYEGQTPTRRMAGRTFSTLALSTGALCGLTDAGAVRCERAAGGGGRDLGAAAAVAGYGTHGCALGHEGSARCWDQSYRPAHVRGTVRPESGDDR